MLGCGWQIYASVDLKTALEIASIVGANDRVANGMLANDLRLSRLIVGAQEDIHGLRRNARVGQLSPEQVAVETRAERATYGEC